MQVSHVTEGGVPGECWHLSPLPHVCRMWDTRTKEVIKSNKLTDPIASFDTSTDKSQLVVAHGKSVSLLDPCRCVPIGCSSKVCTNMVSVHALIVWVLGKAHCYAVENWQLTKAYVAETSCNQSINCYWSRYVRTYIQYAQAQFRLLLHFLVVFVEASFVWASTPAQCA